MTLGPNDLVLPHMAMVGVEPPRTFHDVSFEVRCRAAAAGGFAGLGISPATYRAARDAGLSDADLRSMLEAYGLVLAELEPGRLENERLDAVLDEVLAIADALGTDHAFFVAGDGTPFDAHAEALRHTCDRLAVAGLRVGIEFMPIPGVSAVRSLQDVGRLLDAADRSAAGIVIDTYHFINGGADWSALEQLDPDHIIAVQFTDGAVPPIAEDYAEDSIHHRSPPGEGQFPLTRFVQTLDRMGAAAPWEVEVIDDDLALLDVEERGRRLGDAARATLATARG